MAVHTTRTRTTTSQNIYDKNGRNVIIPGTIFVFAILLRSLIGLNSHSGQDNFHGSTVAYGGDFEAQRHWMELTLHLPIQDWYWHDLEYWGLDYPPLTAYISYLCGLGSYWLVGPESVALYESRGIESRAHKAYMRGTVVVLDMLTYGIAVWYITTATCDKVTTVDNNLQNYKNIIFNYRPFWTMLFAICQPGILLIDHGHFQYNTVALGLSLWSFYFFTLDHDSTNNNNVKNDNNFMNCVYGSIMFCLALNFKQMTLYYAPAIFFYLLGKCCQDQYKYFIQRFCILGATVVTTFGLLWLPFLLNGPSFDDTETTITDRLLHVLHRIFPFQRGLFESKVANLWCALSTKPFSIRDRIPINYQPMAALLLTLLMVLPSGYILFQCGRNGFSTLDKNVDNQKQQQKQQFHHHYHHWNMLLWGSANTALSFFLASFQVHEKSILLAATPIVMLFWQDVIFVQWFTMVSTWTLYPLLQVDRLEAPYFSILIIISILFWFCHELEQQEQQQTATKLSNDKNDYVTVIMKWLVRTSYVGMITLHIFEWFVIPPTSLPDLFPVLWSIAGCVMFALSWIWTLWKLYYEYYQHSLSMIDTKIKVM